MHAAQSFQSKASVTECSRQARINMIKQQVLTNHVQDSRVISALEQVSRERFVPPEFVYAAYGDTDIPLGISTQGIARSVIEPMTLARMLQLAEIQPQDKVLHIGTDSGYATAIIARLASRVYGVEVDEILAARANNHLRAEGVLNAQVNIGPLERGFPNAAPYHVIIATGCVSQVPAIWDEQLAEGGRLVVSQSVGTGAARLGRVSLGIKTGGIVSYRPYFDTNYRPLPGLISRSGFAF